MNTKMSKLALAMSAMVIAGASMAATETGTLSTTATVVNACAIGDGTLAFGSFSVLDGGNGTVLAAATNADASVSLNVACTTGLGGLVTFDSTNYATEWRMKDAGTNYLTYVLHSDAARTTAISNIGTAYTIANTGGNQPITIYGRLDKFANVTAPKGDYTDSVTMTITYTP